MRKQPKFMQSKKPNNQFVALFGFLVFLTYLSTMRNSMNQFVLFVCITIFSFLRAQPALDMESGLVFTGYNNVRIPGDTGTNFSLKEDLKPKPTLFLRLRVNFMLKERHFFSLLYAPLQVQSRGQLNQEVIFRGTAFPAQTELVGDYKFNSYRFTYRYDVVHRPRFQFGIGLTAKIRDARIALSSATLFNEKVNVGFVPIVNFRLFWQMNDTWGLLLDGDALAAPQGRAEDIHIALTHNVSKQLNFRVGYRILEGGSDGRSVYNFSLFHYAAFGATYIWGRAKE